MSKLISKEYSFTAGEQVVFVQSQSFVKNVEEMHCDSHTYYANGCANCEAIAYIKTFSNSDFEKLPIRSFTKHFKKGDALVPLEIQIGNASPKIQLIRQQLARAVAVFFAKEKKKAAKAAAEKYKEIEKAKHEREEVIAYAAFQAIEWNLLINAVETDLLAAAQTGAEEGLSQIGSIDEELKQEINKKLEAYAHERAAEMVGKTYIGTNLVSLAEPHFDISETTKNDLEDEVLISLDKKDSAEEMYDRIISAATFSDVRAQLISKNEASIAQVKGHLTAWSAGRIVTRVGVRLSPSHTVVDECDDLAALTYDIDSVPLIPAHPNCMCTIFAVE